MKKAIFATTLAGLIATQTASAAEIIVNGSFETGDLTGWTTTNIGSPIGGCPDEGRDWNVSASSSTGCSPVSNPIDGQFAAYNMFDGVAQTNYQLSQSIFIADQFTNANLSWLETANWSFGGAARTFSVDLYDAAGENVLANLFSENYSGSGNKDWSLVSLDITDTLLGFAGEAATIAFSVFIPETWSGPAGFGLDAVSLDLDSTPVPEPTGLAILGLSLAGLGLRKKLKK